MDEIDRIRELREGLPSPKPRARAAARAALMERTGSPVPAPGKPRFRRRALALAAAVAATAAAILIVVGSGGGPAVKLGIADAAELRRLAEIFPHPTLAGPWQIISTGGSASEGSTRLRLESEEPSSARTLAEFRWSALPIGDREQQLAAEGFMDRGSLPLIIGRPFFFRTDPPHYGRIFDERGTARVYTLDEPSSGTFLATGLWREHGLTFELRGSVSSLKEFGRLLERTEALDSEEWIVALQPGAASRCPRTPEA